LPVDDTGLVNPDDVRRVITRNTILISVMHANNETGTIQPIEECAGIAREHGVPFHTDAAQSVGKIPTRIDQLGVDLLSIAGHKLYAPKGIGALYVRAGTRLESLVHGAGHEGGRRAGTESVILTAALGTACALAGDLPMETVRDYATSSGHARHILATVSCSMATPSGACQHAQRLLRRAHRKRHPCSLEGIVLRPDGVTGARELPCVTATGIPERVGMEPSIQSGHQAPDEIAEVVERIATFLQPSAGGKPYEFHDRILPHLINLHAQSRVPAVSRTSAVQRKGVSSRSESAPA
jgi:cysteine desulfurase